ncbi:hypothetical protein BZG36_00274 [Bifiguratus adelaidae]|uniref:Uncharacterized protein n=1 Tax=Bifiguratus adelaidae TaxID=1938954 RepID=A0A261Y7U4_9FUNG|nr:hypothetical protein BZG36_00274 [Bifiguratus adelaidae]
MSYEPKKTTFRKGSNKKEAQRHQNTTVWKPNKNSKKTKQINSLPVYGLCQRCTDVILWRKKFRKYKPLTTAKKCTGCQQRTIKEAYHVLCDNCARSKQVCAKCLESKQVIVTSDAIKSHTDLNKEQQDLEKMISMMTERERRSYLRKLVKEENSENEEDGSEDDLDGLDDDDLDSDLDSADIGSENSEEEKEEGDAHDIPPRQKNGTNEKLQEAMADKLAL